MTKRFTWWIRRIHIYAGLLSFSFLILFGVAGLVVTCKAPDIFSSGEPPALRSIPFTAGASASDRSVGKAIEALVAAPPHGGEPYIHRDDANRLNVDWYSVNGLLRATLIENEQRIEVRQYRNSIWRFLDNAHAATVADKSGDPVVRAWTWYMEIAIWSLVGMCLSGMWLGVASRWHFRSARIALGVGFAAFVIFFFLER